MLLCMYILQEMVAQRLASQNKRTVQLDQLLRETKFTKEEIRTMYRGFKQVRRKKKEMPFYEVMHLIFCSRVSVGVMWAIHESFLLILRPLSFFCPLLPPNFSEPSLLLHGRLRAKLHPFPRF